MISLCKFANNWIFICILLFISLNFLELLIFIMFFYFHWLKTRKQYLNKPETPKVNRLYPLCNSIWTNKSNLKLNQVQKSSHLNNTFIFFFFAVYRKCFRALIEILPKIFKKRYWKVQDGCCIWATVKSAPQRLFLQLFPDFVFYTGLFCERIVYLRLCC